MNNVWDVRTDGMLVEITTEDDIIGLIPLEDFGKFMDALYRKHMKLRWKTSSLVAL